MRAARGHFPATGMRMGKIELTTRMEAWHGAPVCADG